MAMIADGIDTLMGLGHDQQKEKKSLRSQRSGVGGTYAIAALGWCFVWGKFSSRDFSAIVTASSYVQLVGFLILYVKISATKSVSGLSSKTLELFMFFYCCRLTATALKSGYNPVDATGDYIYQLIDFAALVLVARLLYCIHKTYAHSYQDEHDTLQITPLVLACVVLGCAVRASFNRNPFFDAMFAVSTNIEAVVMVPQLWMLAKMGGQVDTMTCHFVVSTVASNVMTFTWWWFCACELEKRGPCLLAKFIIAGQVVKLLLAGDFLYYYIVAWLGGEAVVLPTRDGISC